MTVGITELGERLHREFLEAGWRIEIHENMPGMPWKKFAYIAESAAVCAAANCVYEEMRTTLLIRALIQPAIEDALA